MKRYVLALLLIIFMVLYLQKKVIDNAAHNSTYSNLNNTEKPVSNNTSTSKSLDNTKSVELANLIVEFDDDTFTDSANVSLSASGYLWTNKLDYDLGYFLTVADVSKPLSERNLPELKKPLKLIYKAENQSFSRFLKTCNLTPSDISFYTTKRETKRELLGFDEVEKLDTHYDATTNTYTALIESFPRNQNQALIADIVLGAPSTMQYLDCGGDMNAYIEDNRIYYTKEGYSLLLPAELENPKVIPDKTTLNTTISLFPLKNKVENTIRLYVSEKPYSLEIEDLDQLQIPVYEGGTTYTPTDGEYVESREVINIGEVPVLQITSENSITSLKNYFLFRKLESGRIVYIKIGFGSSIDESQASPYITAAKNLIVNISEN